MIAALLSLLLGATPQPWVVKTSQPWVVAKAPTAPVKIERPTYIPGWHFVEPGERTQFGFHWHTCSCGRSVQHGSENNGSRAAHTCVCGEVHWEKSAKPEPITLKRITEYRPEPYCPPGKR